MLTKPRWHDTRLLRTLENPYKQRIAVMQLGKVQLASYLAIFVNLSGCMLGPNFTSPLPPPVTKYTENPQPKKTVSIPAMGQAGKSQYFIEGQDIPKLWWGLFHSHEISGLVERGFMHSPNLVAAEATLRQAQENVNAQVGFLLYPQVNATLSQTRQRFNSATIGGTTASIFNLSTATVNVSYTFDFFGSARRQIEALCAQVDYQRYQLEAAYLTLTSNIVTTAINIASYRAQIEATQAILKSQQNQLHVLEQQLELGGVAGINVMSQQTLVAQTQATLPGLQQALNRARHALATYVGSFPSEFDLPDIRLEKLTLPQHLPISIPSKLVRHRPDVRAAEALMHVASAQIGVATANLFPTITLNGTYGWQSPIPSNLFKPISNIWSYTGTLTQPIFNGGGLMAQKRAAVAGYEAAAAQYQQVVLQAFQNVADSLRALQFDAATLRAQTLAEKASLESLRVIRQQYRVGGINYTSLLVAEQQYQQTVIARVQAQAARFNDTAALFQALGGGWWS